MTATISRLFDDRTAAMEAVRKLEAAGLPHSEISILSNNSDSWYSDNTSGRSRTAETDTGGRVDRDRDGVDDRAEAAGTGAGLLAGLGLLAIPGLGPVVAAGWLASTAAGAVAGAATGGLVGALTQIGVPEDEAHAYAEGVRRGGTMVVARVADADRGRYEQILNASSVNIRDRSAAYRKTGWSKFDPSAKPFTADEVRRERDLYRTGRGV
jgi:hypothetical protein